MPAKKARPLNSVPEYKVWLGMRRRCENPKMSTWKNYGARGILVCDDWMVFDRFFADMGPRPTLKHEIDRRNNDGHYNAENCRWATRKQQSNNRRSSRLLIHNSETLTVAQWSERMEIGYGAFIGRLNRNGDDIPSALQPRRPQVSYVTYDGATFSVSVWAGRLGINPVTLHARLRRGMPIDLAFTSGTMKGFRSDLIVTARV